MSLIVSDRATQAQIDLLKKLEYYGDLNLSMQEASELIDEYIEQRRMDEADMVDGLSEIY